MTKRAKVQSPAVSEPWAITEIQVAGFKSISEEQRIEIRPLTILAGANSSGKSSMMQPLLLLKQTLETSYDPGPLLLNGPNVKFTSADQLLSRIGKRHSSDIFEVGLRLSGMFQTPESHYQITFRKEHKMGFRLEQIRISDSSGAFALWPDMTAAEIIASGITKGKDHLQSTAEGDREGQWEIKRDRCLIGLSWVRRQPNGMESSATEHTTGRLEAVVPQVIHLPGLRGNPERSYPVTAVGPSYPGTFEIYTASAISAWMEDNKEALEELNSDLRHLKMTGGVTATRPNGVQIELWVGRLPEMLPTRPEDRVNIADVGVGVSQSLPILVALHAVKPGQLVYVEQPETHLHPSAQFALAQILANAANRGVRVVVETHSSILLLGVQTLVAESSLQPDKVKLHWFERQKDGHTVVRPGELDEAGRFGEWPEDFDNVSLKAESRFLDAAEAKLARK